MLLKLIPNKLKVWLIKHLYADIAEMGDGGDTELAHVNLKEVAILKAHGGAGTINPRTGLVEFKGKGGGGGGGGCVGGGGGAGGYRASGFGTPGTRGTALSS